MMMKFGVRFVLDNEKIEREGKYSIERMHEEIDKLAAMCYMTRIKTQRMNKKQSDNAVCDSAKNRKSQKRSKI